MTLTEKVRRLLWSRSGGYCQNPGCNADIFVFFEDGSVGNIDELAHIIAEKAKGPRGNAKVALADRNAFENILVLCPKCHRLIDKNPAKFSVAELKAWKADHQARIAGLFRAPMVTSRADLLKELEPRLRQSRSIFEQFGPHSEGALDGPKFEEARQWHRLIRSSIIPNNRYIADLLTRNASLLTASEKDVLDRYLIHQEAFEYNHLSGDKNAAAPLFPAEMNDLLRDQNGE